jgi:uncharacterized protein (DUF433 family)
MPKTAPRVRHPHIVIRKGFCGGSPVIAGTKFPVRSVVNYVLRQGMTPEELAAEFSHPTQAQIHDAHSYYYDHQRGVDQDLAANSEDGVRGQLGCARSRFARGHRRDPGTSVH